jgi:hypothetical protein
VKFRFPALHPVKVGCPALHPLLSVYLALRKYRSEKWWEHKSKCYVDTVSAMNDMITFCDMVSEEVLDGEVLPEKIRKEFEERYHNAKRILEAQTNVGDLLMSKVAHEDLMALNRALYKVGQEPEGPRRMAGIRLELEECLLSFIPHAKQDLGVQKL